MRGEAGMEGGEEGMYHGVGLVIMGDSEFEKKKKHMVYHVGLAASGMNEWMDRRYVYSKSSSLSWTCSDI